MGFFGNYHEQPIQKGYVEKEGDYEVMILGTKDGRTPDGAMYKQVLCKVNAPGEPRLSIFLTDGRNFDGNFTAFCDTFGLPRGNEDFNYWVGKRGWIHILLNKKDGFTNMIPRWLLGEDGYVIRGGSQNRNSQSAQGGQGQQMTSQGQQQQGYGQTTAQQEEEWGDIPF